MNATTDSQCSLILARLRKTPGQWVSMPDLVKVSGSYNIHTRIDNLRHVFGQVIECKIERQRGSRRQFSYYRIPESSPVAA